MFGGSKFNKQRYLDTLKMMYDMLNKARRDGLVALEADIEEPDKSASFSKYPSFLKDHHVRDFVCDTLRMAVDGRHRALRRGPDDGNGHGRAPSRARQPIAALSTMADALPGLGIVAAVLGVVITMGAFGGPPEEIGHKVAAALVGTFLGILLCYGLVGPVAANMAKAADDEHAYYHVLRVSDSGVHERHFADYGGGDRAARDSRPCPSLISGSGANLSGRRSGGSSSSGSGTGGTVGMSELMLCLEVNPSSSSRKRAVTAAIMAAPGRSLTPISSLP